jgi:stress-induced-phosphoprotein 1
LSYHFKGNLHFKSLEFDKALEAYTECIDKANELSLDSDIMATLYANRAITNIKLGEYLKAEEDGNKALSFEPKHIKALIRRGRAKHKLNKLKEALSDFETAREIEKDNKEVTDEIAIIKKKMEKLKKEQKEKMVYFLF